MSNTAAAPSWRRNATSRAAHSAAGSPCSAASTATDWGDRETTTVQLGSASRCSSSPALWCWSNTVSADVTHPLQARQSCSDTLTGWSTAAGRVCEKPRGCNCTVPTCRGSDEHGPGWARRRAVTAAGRRPLAEPQPSARGVWGLGARRYLQQRACYPPLGPSASPPHHWRRPACRPPGSLRMPETER